MEFGAWCNFVEVVRGLQHNLLKLSAFADWWQDIQQGEEFQLPFRAPTCGATFDDEDLYADHARWSIASYLIVPNDCFSLDPNRRVDLSPRNSSRMDAMSIQLIMHSLHLWYHPPHVRDVYANFKTAARGYADRLGHLQSKVCSSPFFSTRNHFFKRSRPTDHQPAPCLP